MGKAGKYVYAVKKGRVPGIYDTWDEAEAQVKGFSRPEHKKFLTASEAQRWLASSDDGTVMTPIAPVHGEAIRARDVPSPLTAGSSASSSSAYKRRDTSVAFDPLAEKIVAYTDGAAKNNQEESKRIAGFGVHWAVGRPAGVVGDIAEPCPGPPGSGKTNNYGELQAIIRVLELTKNDPRLLTIYSDSQYSIQCFDWLQDWSNKGWKNSKGETPANLDMIRYMVALRALREMRQFKTIIEHVKGHATSAGNINADALANRGAFMSHTSTLPEPDWKRLRKDVEAELIVAKARRFGTSAQREVVNASGKVASVPGKVVNAPAKVMDLKDVDLSVFEASDILEDDAALLAELNEC